MELKAKHTDIIAVQTRKDSCICVFFFFNYHFIFFFSSLPHLHQINMSKSKSLDLFSARSITRLWLTLYFHFRTRFSYFFCCLYYWDVCWSLITHFSDHGQWYWLWFSHRSHYHRTLNLYVCPVKSPISSNLQPPRPDTCFTWVKSFTFFFHLLSLHLCANFFSSHLVCCCRFSSLFSTCSLLGFDNNKWRLEGSPIKQNLSIKQNDSFNERVRVGEWVRLVNIWEKIRNCLAMMPNSLSLTSQEILLI